MQGIRDWRTGTLTRINKAVIAATNGHRARVRRSHGARRKSHIPSVALGQSGFRVAAEG